MAMKEKEKIISFLEFKAHDSAWYEASLELELDKLRVRYLGVGVAGEEEEEEELSLQNVERIEELKNRFRCPSRFLEDKHCRKALPGTYVCAFHSDADRRYFDARVENVVWSRHMIVNREEQCMCTYEVLWLAGPYEGKKTTIHCENICLRRYKSIQSHPIIKDVLNYLQNKRTRKSQTAAEIALQEKIVCFTDKVHRSFKPKVHDFLAQKVEKGINYGHELEKNLISTGNEGKRIHNLENERNETCELYNRSKLELTRKRCYNEIIECNAKKFTYDNASEHCEPLSEVTKVDCIIGFESSASILKGTKRLEDSSKLDLISSCCYDEIIEFDDKNAGYDGSSEPESQSTKVDNVVVFERSAPPWKGMGKVEENVKHKLKVKDSKLPSENIFHLHDLVNVSNEVYADGNLSFPKQENMDTLAASCKLESCAFEKGTLAYIAQAIENVKGENLLKRPSECSGGIVDCVSPRIGKDHARDILGECDNGFDCHPGHFSVAGHGNCVNEWKEFPEACLKSLDDSNKILSHMMIKDVKQDVRSKENVPWERGKIWDAAQNRAIMTTCNIYSRRRGRQPKVTNNVILDRVNYNQNCGSQRKEEPKNQRSLFPSAHVLILENLDKNLTPSDVLSVISHAGGDSANVYIIPNRFFEKFTRGFVYFQDKASLQMVSAFLQNEKILIASSDGRPWVVIYEGNELSQRYFPDLTSGSEQYCRHVLSNNIHILFKGTPEYEKADKLRSKFLEWREHLKQLHKGFAYS